MLGIWKSFEELEECLSYQELGFILKEKRRQEYEMQRFTAGLKGIDLDKQREKTESIEKRLEAVQRRAKATLAGGEKELEKQEWADLGFGFESG